VLRLDLLVLQVHSQTIYHLSRNEHYLGILAALGALDGKLLVIYISGSEPQNLAHPHPSSGHQFQDEPVSNLCRPEDDFFDRLFLDNIPAVGFAGPIEPTQHGCITGVLKGGIKIGHNEIEERLEVGVTAVFGLLFQAFCHFAQERQNFVGCDGGKIPILAKVITEFGKRNAIGLNRISFPYSSCGTLDRLELLAQIS
jgi:hypothetical protein